MKKQKVLIVLLFFLALIFVLASCESSPKTTKDEWTKIQSLDDALGSWEFIIKPNQKVPAENAWMLDIVSKACLDIDSESVKISNFYDYSNVEDIENRWSNIAESVQSNDKATVDNDNFLITILIDTMSSNDYFSKYIKTNTFYVNQDKTKLRLKLTSADGKITNNIYTKVN